MDKSELFTQILTGEIHLDEVSDDDMHLLEDLVLYSVALKHAGDPAKVYWDYSSEIH
jgi:hypothetical protein